MSSFNLGRYVVQSGPFGWLAILATLILVVVGLVMLSGKKGRRAFLGFSIAALLPLLCGGAGTVLGNVIVDRKAAESTEMRAAEVQRGREQARIPLVIGGIGTLLLLSLGAMGAIDSDPSSGQANA